MSVGADGPTRLRALTEAQAEAQAEAQTDGQGNAPVAANDNNRVETDRSTAGIGSDKRMLYAGGSPEASAGASVSDTIRHITAEELTALGLFDPANDNTPLTILDIQRDNTPARVYNLSVETLPGQLTHNYFVGEDGVWVHNGRFFRGKMRDRIWGEKGGTCTYCGKNKATECDHIWPWSKGGPTSWWNGLWACKSCNVGKGNKLPFLQWTPPRFRK